jgi:hypothetical protein
MKVFHDQESLEEHRTKLVLFLICHLSLRVKLLQNKLGLQDLHQQC